MAAGAARNAAAQIRFPEKTPASSGRRGRPSERLREPVSPMNAGSPLSEELRFSEGARFFRAAPPERTSTRGH